MTEQEKGPREEEVPPSRPPQEDEIDLAELVGVLYRHKWLIIIVTLVVLSLAGAYTALQKTPYRVSALIELGQLLTKEGYQKVESPKEAKNRLSSLARVTGERIISESQEANSTLGFSIQKDFSIEVPENGNIISLEVLAPRDSKAMPFLNRTIKLFIADHNRVFDQEKTRLRNQIKRKKLAKQSVDIQIKNLKNNISQIKRKYEQKITSQNNKIQRLQNSIENIVSQKNYLEQKVSLLQEEKDSLGKRIKKAQERYNQLLDSKLAANRDVQGAEAVGLMLFSNEVQRIHEQLYQLRDRQLFKIPEQINKLQTQIQELNTQIRNTRSKKELAKQELEQLKPELNEKVEEVQGKIENKNQEKKEIQTAIEELQNRLKNVFTTQVITEPSFSDNPISSNMKLYLGLGFVLGVFVGVFLAFFVEFWQRNKDKILQK